MADCAEACGRCGDMWQGVGVYGRGQANICMGTCGRGGTCGMVQWHVAGVVTGVGVCGNGWGIW